MDWIIRHHTAVLLWITALSAYAAGTTCYHSPALGVILKVAALALIIVGVIEARKEYDYGED